MLDTLAGTVKSTNELTVVYGTVIVVTDYCPNGENDPLVTIKNAV